MPQPALPLAAARPDALARGARRAMACAAALPALMLAAWLGAGPAAAQSAPPLTYAQPLAPAATARVQERLRDLGAYQGRVDGIWGPESQQALERFQQGRGLQANGQINPATLSALGLDPGAPAAPPR
jgi:peptidoglycan hydrolase-like protein with peptidoglycan-binding domain